MNLHCYNFLKTGRLLIDNAVKFTFPGLQPKIRVTSTENEHASFFKIEDNGIGIQTDFRKEVFEIFNQINSETYGSGIGIGLSICKKIVEMQNGAIWLEDSKLGGLAVVWQIPKKGNLVPKS